MKFRLGILLVLALLSSGCAKGALWKLGYLNPQVRKQWAEEEQYAKSWHSIKADMTAAVERANAGGQGDQQNVAGQLATMIKDDHRIMVRLHATELLGELPSQTAMAAANLASEDPEPDVRMAACHVYGKWGDSDSLYGLRKVLGSDTNPDVRIASARAIGRFQGPEAAKALQVAIESEHPALQLAAADSLENCTGKNFGQDIPKWQEYLANSLPAQNHAISQVGVQESKSDKSKIRLLNWMK